MATRINNTATLRKRREGKLFTPTNTPPATPGSALGAAPGGAPLTTPTGCSDGNLEIAPMDFDDVLGMIAKVVGRKQLEHRMRVSPSLLNQWISGDKVSFLYRTEEFVDIIADLGHPDLALALIDRLCRRLRAAVLSEDQIKAIKQIAQNTGTRVNFDEWRNR